MENKNQEVNFENNSENTFPRTKFLISVGYLIIQILIPGIILFLLLVLILLLLLNYLFE